MKKIVIATALVLCLAVWCCYQLGKQENRYRRCGRANNEKCTEISGK